MKPPASDKPRFTGFWTRNLNYSCPHCGKAATTCLWKGAEETTDWNCPHCQTQLSVYEPAKRLRVLLQVLLALVAFASFHKFRELAYLLFLLGFWLGLRTHRLKVSLAPAAKPGG